MAYPYVAGVWEQRAENDGLVVYSRHRTREAARAAALRYARDLNSHGQSTGGALSWCGGWRAVEHGSVCWVRHDGTDPFLYEEV